MFREDWYAGTMTKQRDGSEPKSSVGELEASVLEMLWDSGELSTPAVHELVGKPRGLAYTTILTVLQRLHRKRLVTRREQGKSHAYAAAISRTAFAERRAQSLASEVMALGPAGMAAFLAEATRLDPEAVELARRELAERE